MNRRQVPWVRFARTHSFERANPTLSALEPYTEVNPNLLLAYDYPFLGIFWSLLVFFVWISWFMLLFRVIGDIFSRRDIGGGSKVLWLIFVIALPFLGVFVYLIANNEAMTTRTVERAQAQQQQVDEYIRSTASSGGAAAEIDKAKQLLDSGAITQAEFDALKQKALA